MEFDSDEEFTWVRVDNTVKDRMVDSSLIHKLVPRKLQKRTKILNKKFAKMSNIKSYSQYVSIKTSVLRDCTDNDETEDEVMSDNEYAMLYKSEESLKHYMSTSSDRLWQISWEDEYDDTRTPEKHKKRKIKESSRQRKKKTKEKVVTDIDVGWRSVSRKRHTTSQRDLNYSNREPTTSTASMEEESTMTDNDSLDKSEKDQLDPLGNNTEEGPIRKKQKLVKYIKRNLTSELESVDSTTSTQVYKTEQEEDISDDFNSNWNYPWHESNSFLGQSTPLKNIATAKISVPSQTISPSKYIVHQPKDSGIDEDSQEESSREGKNNAETIPSQTQMQNGDLIKSPNCQYMSIKKACKTDDTSGESANVNEQIILDFIIEKEEQHSTPIKKGKSHKANITPSKEKLEKPWQNENKATIIKNKVLTCRNAEEESATILENEESVSHDEKSILDHAEAENTINEMDEDVLGTVRRDNVDVDQNEFDKVPKEIIEQIEERTTMIKENSNTSDSTLTPETCDALDSMVSQKEHGEEVINKSQDAEMNEENDSPSKMKNTDEVRKKKMPPKVMRTEVVNQKYKIIAKDQINEHTEKSEDTEKALNGTTHDSHDSTICVHDKETDISKLNNDSDSDAVHEESYNFDETLRIKEDHEIDNETDSEINSYPNDQHTQREENVNINNSSKKDEEKQEPENRTVRPFPVHVFRTNELFRSQEVDEDSDDNVGGNMSPRAVRRLQQLKRLNLITGSDSSSDDEEHLQKSRLSKPIQIDGPVTHANCKVEMKEEVQCEHETSQIHKQKNFNTKKDDDDDEMSDSLRSTESKEDLKEDTKEHTKTSILSLKRHKKVEESSVSDDEEQKLREDVESNLTDRVPEIDSLKRVLSPTSQKTVENNCDSIDKQSVHEDSNVATKRKIKSYKRPCTLDNLITEEELSVYEIAPSFTLKDMDEDEEVFILNIPNTVDLCSLKNQRMVLKSNKLKLGNQKLKILHTNTDAVTCVFHKGKKNASYKTVNIKPVGTIIARHKLSEVTDLQKLEQSTEDDDSAFESLSIK